MKRLALTILSSLLIAANALSNPIVINGGLGLEKTHEQCAIAVGAKSAAISCKVDYSIERRAAGGVHINLPIFWPRTKEFDTEKADKLLAVTLECDGEVYTPTSLGKATAASLEEKPFIELNCSFFIKLPKKNNFTLIVTYNQPLINGVCYYEPLFEKDPPKDKLKNFNIMFFPTNKAFLELTSKHEERASIMKTRISITPKHREMIAVKSVPNKE